MPKHWLLALAVWLAVWTVASHAQAPPPAAPVLTPEQERALALVLEELDGTKLLEPKGRRVEVLTQAAALLWKPRQAKAREVFQSAYDLAVEAVRDREDTAQKQGTSRVNTRGDLRFDVIRAIAKYDAAWARRLTGELLAEKKEQAEPAQANTSGQALATELPWHAEKLLSVDQATALTVARASQPGVAGDALARFLVALAKQDRPAADAFFREALAVIAKRSVGETLRLSTYALAQARPIGPEWRSVFVIGAAELAPNPALQLHYLDIVLQLAAQYAVPSAEAARQSDGAYGLPPAAKLWLALSDLEPLVAARFPPLQARLLESKTALGGVLASEQAKTAQGILTEKQPQPGSAFDHLLEKAAAEKDPGKRDFLYFQALIAGADDEEQGALEDLLLKFSDAETRRQMSDWLYFKLAQRASQQGRFDEAAKLAERVGPLDLRAYLAFQLAEAAFTKLNDRQRAGEYLDAAWRVADKADTTNEQAKTLLGISHLYLRFGLDRANGWSALRAAVKTINQLTEPQVETASFTKIIKGRTFQAHTLYDMPGFGLSNAFREWGRADFENALSSARELADRGLRANAMLALAAFRLEQVKEAPPAAKKSKQ